MTDERDPLTGIGSRRAGLAVLEGCVERDEPFALLFCDIDRFRHFNAAFGHARGDEELCRIARNLERICAPHPVFCFGGNEFLVVLQERSLEEARESAQQILSSHPPVTVPHEGSSPVQALTFSIGFALFPTHALDAEKLLHAADIALLKAKRGGRLPAGSPFAGRHRALTWGDFLDEFPAESARFLNPDFVCPHI